MNVHPRATAVVVVCLGWNLSAATSSAAEPNVVVRWNQALLQSIRNTGFAPMFAARALAVVHTSMYDAWAAYDEVAVGTRPDGPARQPAAARTSANREKAVSFAAYQSLVDLRATQKAVLFDPLMAELGFDPADTSAAAMVGRSAAAAVQAFRHADGSNQLGDAPGGTPGAAYSDYTHYAPVNDGTTVVDPNRWQPLITNPATGAMQVFLAPHWGGVTPFALSPASEFRPPEPPLFPNGRYRKEANQVLHLSASLDDRRKAIAAYWADGPNTETPPGHWNLFAQFVSERDGHGVDEDVRMFFILGNALFDASVSAWEGKRHFDFVRPITAIRYLYAGRPVRAWGGPGRGTRLIEGGQFQPYIATPPFAEYVSGHSTFSAASAEILERFTGSDAFGASVIIAAGSSPIEAGVPAHPLTLSWRTFSEAADEAGLSRRYGGIHFESGDLEGRALGRNVGVRAWEKAQSYFDGSALP
ncbi:MAG TPA: vanadium-dependent haloperoxidase [Vicinamibacteria bacterium]|nr:vanadium-dependent haloperoxidase [Vicinamibacteria bacterium]